MNSNSTARNPKMAMHTGIQQNVVFTKEMWCLDRRKAMKFPIDILFMVRQLGHMHWHKINKLKDS